MLIGKMNSELKIQKKDTEGTYSEMSVYDSDLEGELDQIVGESSKKLDYSKRFKNHKPITHA